MPQKLTRHQVNGIKKLVPFKKFFKKEKSEAVIHLYQKTKPEDNKNAQKFIETFCGHNLADTDYGLIQSDINHYDSLKQFVNEASIETILKYLTYVIWTDKFINGYFSAKVNDHTIYYLIDRLEVLLNSWGIKVES